MDLSAQQMRVARRPLARAVVMVVLTAGLRVPAST